MLTEYDIAIVTDQFANDDVTPDTHDGVQKVHFCEHSSFGLPGWMWAGLFASYATFFAALALATARDGTSMFAIVVSILYTVMFFGTAAVLQGLGKKAMTSLFERGQGRLDTSTGPMGTATVAAQVLTVPVLFAVFAIAIVIMRAIIGF